MNLLALQKFFFLFVKTCLEVKTYMYVSWDPWLHDNLKHGKEKERIHQIMRVG